MNLNQNSIKVLPRFIVIDGNKISSLITHKLIKTIIPEAKVKIFNHPEEGINCIRQLTTDDMAYPTCLLLEIHINPISGWETLDKINPLLNVMKDFLFIYILSASIFEEDRNRAMSNSMVKGYIEKPLNSDKLTTLCDDIFLHFFKK